MPIVVGHTSGADEAGLALAAGSAMGRGQRMQQQRQIDASLTSQVLGQNHDLNRLKLLRGYERQDQDRADRIQRDNISLALEKMKLDAQDSATRRMESQAKIENDQREFAIQQRSKDDMLATLDQTYEGRPKDLLYGVARNEVMTKGQFSERTASALGISTQAEQLARTKAEVSGTLDQFEPKTAEERRSRRLMQQGDFGSVAGQLNRLQGGLLEPGDPGYNDVVDAAIQVQGWAKVTNDPTQIQAAIQAFTEKGVNQEMIAPLEDRLEEIRQQEVMIKAPMAFETALGAFESQAMNISKQLGRPLSPVESSTLLGKTLQTTLASAGITSGRFEEWMNSQEDTQAQATKAIQGIMAKQQAQYPMGDNGPTGSEEAFGSDAEPMPTMQDFPGVIIKGGKATYPDYLVPVDPRAGGFTTYIDTRTGQEVNSRQILAAYLPEIYRQQGVELGPDGLPVKPKPKK